MTEVMKTLWSESSDLEEEMMGTRSVLSDDYTSHDIKRLADIIEEQKREDEQLENDLHVGEDE
ncbi:MAG: hypothetical protein E7085_04220 [Parabacteroides distasonis]|nr:hypothetical protein [Parabacteroides distasonis]MBR2496926.1 hypothetical protein [Parabacteroides sp.]